MHSHTDETALAAIDAHLGEADGELTRRSTVIDGLLDLRSTVGDDDDLIAAIDLRLGDVPGQSVTPTKWWVEELEDLRQLIVDRPAPARV